VGRLSYLWDDMAAAPAASASLERSFKAI
jgi:hypothetical protein